MKKVTVRVCSGTTCFVMGASNLQMLHEHVPEELRDWVDIQGAHCLELCRDRNYGAAPYITIDDEIVAEADLSLILERIEQRVRG